MSPNRCPTCAQALKPLPTRDGFLAHYWCRECRTIWAYYPTPDCGEGFSWMPCEDPVLHLPDYVSAPLMRNLEGGGLEKRDQDPQKHPRRTPTSASGNLTPTSPTPPPSTRNQ